MCGPIRGTRNRQVKWPADKKPSKRGAKMLAVKKTRRTPKAGTKRK